MNNFEPELAESVKGLMFPSESERPIEFVDFNQDPYKSLEEKYSGKTNLIEKSNFDEFYEKYAVEKDWQNDIQKGFAKKLAAALDLMKKYLSEIQVFRVGEINVDIYIIGKSNQKWIGLMTSAVET